jgi:hypothetical protein
VWYRFFPDVDGRISMQAVGFDATLALLPFTSVATPLPQGFTCANARDDTIERLNARVRAGSPYAVQVGGAAGAAGPLQVTFTFTPDRDGDGIGDDRDGCPRLPGTAGGCPPRITASIPYKFDTAPDGVRFRYIQIVDAPFGARVDVRCSRGCRRYSFTVRSNVTRLRSFRGRYVRRGASIEVRVTKRGYIGIYRRFAISAGDVRTTSHCLPPGANSPQRTCD